MKSLNFERLSGGQQEESHRVCRKIQSRNLKPCRIGYWVRSDARKSRRGGTRVSDSDRPDAFHFGRSFKSSVAHRFVGRLTSVSSSLLNNAQFLRPDLQYHSIVVLFDSVPTRFCLGTWQTLLSSPLLVMWKSKPLALGPHLIALLNVVSRVLSQVAQAHQ